MNIRLLFICILATAASASLTAFGCRFSQRRHRKAGWYLAVMASISTGVLAVLFFFGSEAFHFDEWSANAGVLPCFLIIIGIGIIPGLLVVRFFRERFRDDNHVA